jgi:hypothetical protein
MLVLLSMCVNRRRDVTSDYEEKRRKDVRVYEAKGMFIARTIQYGSGIESLWRGSRSL